MAQLIQRLIKSLKRKTEAKRVERRRSRIEYCIRKSNIKMDDLIPIQKIDYNQIVKDLEEKVLRMNLDEPKYIKKDIKMPDGSVIHNYPVQNIYSWSEIIASMKSRRREAYYIKNRPCSKCGNDTTIFFCFRSSKDSWKKLCGREGYMLICPDCLTILGFVPYLMN